MKLNKGRQTGASTQHEGNVKTASCYSHTLLKHKLQIHKPNTGRTSTWVEFTVSLDMLVILEMSLIRQFKFRGHSIKIKYDFYQTGTLHNP